MTVVVDRENFEKEVIESTEPVLLDFWGPQCKPCLALMPTVEKFEKDFVGKLKVAKLNAAENRILCAKLRVLGLPTFIVYKNGMEVSRLVGEQISVTDLKKAIDSVLL